MKIIKNPFWESCDAFLLTQSALALFFIAFNPGQIYAHTYYVHGAGAVSCGKWTQDRRDSVPLAGALESWVQGFISAANGAMAQPGAPMFDWAADTNDEGVFAWIDNYCAAHPLNHVSTAADAMFGELMARRQGAAR